MNRVIEWARTLVGSRRPPVVLRSEMPKRQVAFVPRWTGPLFLLMAGALVPWIVYLAISLPSRTVFNHYRTAWVGFDILLVLAMARTAFLALKGGRRIELPASATATLLIVDAWFDVTTSRPGAAQLEAVILAIFVELPTAALAIYLSRKVERAIDETLDRLSDDVQATELQETEVPAI